MHQGIMLPYYLIIVTTLFHKGFLVRASDLNLDIIPAVDSATSSPDRILQSSNSVCEVSTNIWCLLDVGTDCANIDPIPLSDCAPFTVTFLFDFCTITFMKCHVHMDIICAIAIAIVIAITIAITSTRMI